MEEVLFQTVLMAFELTFFNINSVKYTINTFNPKPGNRLPLTIFDTLISALLFLVCSTLVHGVCNNRKSRFLTENSRFLRNISEKPEFLIQICRFVSDLKSVGAIVFLVK